MASKDIFSELIKLGATSLSDAALEIPKEVQYPLQPAEEAPAPVGTSKLVTEVCNRAVEALDRSIQSQKDLREALLELSALCSSSSEENSEEEPDIPVEVDESQL